MNIIVRQWKCLPVFIAKMHAGGINATLLTSKYAAILEHNVTSVEIEALFSLEE